MGGLSGLSSLGKIGSGAVGLRLCVASADTGAGDILPMPRGAGGDIRPTLWPGGETLPEGDTRPTRAPGGDIPPPREEG